MEDQNTDHDTIDIANMQHTQAEESEADHDGAELDTTQHASHDSLEQERTELDTTPDSQTVESITTQLAVSHLTEDPAKTVFATAELHLMVLSHLRTKDLTHALSVSKYWQKTILDSVALRRNLFLEPKPVADDFLDWKLVGNEREPVIVQQPTESSTPIIDLHPVLGPWPDVRAKLIADQRLSSLLLVAPSTFLTQPPVTKVYLGPWPHFLTLERQEGVTFDGVVEALRRSHTECRRGTSGADEDEDEDEGFSFSTNTGHVVSHDVADDMFCQQGNDCELLKHPVQDHVWIRIDAKEVIPEASKYVQRARWAFSRGK